MHKTVIKAFVCSFSVSLLAILTANRVFCHAPQNDQEPLEISKKNIVLFLKTNETAKFPTKKIALNTLPEIPKHNKDTDNPEPEVILAGVDEDLIFPLEVDDYANEPAPIQDLVLTDVLYAPDKPLPLPEIEAEAVYEPKDEVKIAEKSGDKGIREQKIVYSAAADKKITPPLIAEAAAESSQEEQALVLARQEQAGIIPLQKSANQAPKNVTIGNPENLNHIAMDKPDVPIQSLEKEIAQTIDNEDADQQWQKMSDSPWVIAQSKGGKNKMLNKDLTGKSTKEIDATFNPQPTRAGVEVASETVKNLIIPIPGDIMNDDDLTPKLAYPPSSDDAIKEKIIDAEIKRQEKLSAQEEVDKELLTPIEEEIVLDVDIEKNPLKEDETTKKASEQQKKAESKGGTIVKALTSIFSKPKDDQSSTKASDAIDKAKERAIAKAKAKRAALKDYEMAKPVSIMPTEIRLSFQPNRAEISGQTLRWVQAFASKAAETPETALEIRIDGTSSTALQQRRLNLLHNILTNKGVEYSKINIVFTAREPNSFVLRTINTKGETDKINETYQTQYIQW